MTFNKTFIILCFTIISCDCGFDLEFNVKNETSNNIQIKFRHNDNDVNLEILPNEVKHIATTIGGFRGCIYGKSHRILDADSSLRYVIQNIEITKNDSIKTKTNFNYEYNWEFESFKNTGKYIAHVKDSDF